MTLIKSISGIRGTIGGRKGDNLTPIDIVECVAGFAAWIKEKGAPLKVVVGRDGRISGEMVSNLAIQTLIGYGFEVINLDYSTTPTVEMMVPHLNAGAGIIFTASHNPKQWNALKFLNSKGEFISANDGQRILDIIAANDMTFAEVDELGTVSKFEGAIDIHIEEILNLDYVDVRAVSKANLHVVVDCINSTGAISIPPLLEKLGVTYDLINKEITGDFAHNPEPLPEHVFQLSEAVQSSNADLGIIVDPDVDRLAFLDEHGDMFGEEYTLVAVADYMLSKQGGNAVSNLSSTRALKDIADKYNGQYTASAVGEVNVVETMKATNAIIGGEGNGGIIVPGLHYGRDALVGTAIFLTHLAKSGIPASRLKQSYPQYYMVKDKISIKGKDVNQVLAQIENAFPTAKFNKVDGLKLDFEDHWIHIRKSNTEPIIRVYTEASSNEKARSLVQEVMNIVN